MAIEYTMTATCDKCGVNIEPPMDVKKSQLDLTRWIWRDKWRKQGVMRGQKSLRGQAKLYCSKCAGN